MPWKGVDQNFQILNENIEKYTERRSRYVMMYLVNKAVYRTPIGKYILTGYVAKLITLMFVELLK